MALTFTEVPQTRGESGQFRERMFDIILDTDYPTAGWPIAPATVGLLDIYGAEIIGSVGAAGAAATTNYLFSWDYINKKLQAFDTGAAQAAPLDETTAGDNDLDTRRVRVRFIGI
jgi:hypothetical protein